MMVFDRRSDIIDGKYNTEASFLSPPGMTGADTVFFSFCCACYCSLYFPLGRQEPKVTPTSNRNDGFIMPKAGRRFLSGYTRYAQDFLDIRAYFL